MVLFHSYVSLPKGNLQKGEQKNRCGGFSSIGDVKCTMLWRVLFTLKVGILQKFWGNHTENDEWWWINLEAVMLKPKPWFPQLFVFLSAFEGFGVTSPPSSALGHAAKRCWLERLSLTTKSKCIICGRSWQFWRDFLRPSKNAKTPPLWRLLRALFLHNQMCLRWYKAAVRQRYHTVLWCAACASPPSSTTATTTTATTTTTTSGNQEPVWHCWCAKLYNKRRSG